MTVWEFFFGLDLFEYLTIFSGVSSLLFYTHRIIIGSNLGGQREECPKMLTRGFELRILGVSLAVS